MKKDKLTKAVKAYQKLDENQKLEFASLFDDEFSFQDYQGEQLYLDLLDRRLSIAQTISLTLQTEDGKPVYSAEWLARNILGFSDEEISEFITNKKEKE